MRQTHSSRCARPRPALRGGFSAVYTVIMVTALCGVISLGVDYGRVQLAKTQLRTATDAAARAGAASLKDGPAAARSAAVAMAAANACDSVPVALDANLDIELGRWDPTHRTFIVLTGSAESSATAVRITARRTSARGNPVPLTFARFVGKETCDVNASAIGTVGAGIRPRVVALQGGTVDIFLKNSVFFGSYNSSVTVNPTVASAGYNSGVASNGIIELKNSGELRGAVHLAPGGDVIGDLTVTGGEYYMPAPITAPAQPAWTPAANPGGIPQNYIVSAPTVLPGGTYWFTSLTIDRNLSFSAPASVYVNGNVVVDADLTASGSIPSNLKIYQIGTGRTFGDSKTNNTQITAQIEATGTEFVFKNKLIYRGTVMVERISLKNAADFFTDDAAEPPGAPQIDRTVSLVR